jgi:hypothetical protein
MRDGSRSPETGETEPPQFGWDHRSHHAVCDEKISSVLSFSSLNPGIPHVRVQWTQNTGFSLRFSDPAFVSDPLTDQPMG